MVRIGFVGAGGMARAHMQQLSTLDNAKLVAFCDIDKSRAEGAAAEYGGTAYTSHEDMFDREELDAMYVCIPPSAHSDQELLAAERGLALFVEKPVAVAAAKGEEISQAIEQRGVVASVGYHWRYTEIANRARELLTARQVSFALGHWTGGMPGVPWWRVMAQSGGQMVEQTTHIFDLARYLLGEVTQVSAFGASGLMTDVENFGVHDSSVANLSFESGAIACITSACLLSAGGRVGLDLYGKGLVLRLGTGPWNGIGIQTVEPGRTETIENSNNPTLEEDKVFLEAVETGDPAKIRSPYSDGLRTLKVTLAANESIATGQPVSP